MSFWENSRYTSWWFFTASVFFAYLFGVFAIIGDLFREHGRNGWWKSLKESRAECWSDGVRGIEER